MGDGLDNGDMLDLTLSASLRVSAFLWHDSYQTLFFFYAVVVRLSVVVIFYNMEKIVRDKFLSFLSNDKNLSVIRVLKKNTSSSGR